MQVHEALENYRLDILHLSPHTQRWYVEKLTTFADWCKEHALSLEDVKTTTINQFLDYLRTTPGTNTGKTRSTYTIHGYAEVIRTFVRWAAGDDEYEVSGRALNRFKMPPVEKKVIQTFSPIQIKALFAACDKEYFPTLRQRDRALVWTLLDTGIRAGEAAGLTLERTHTEGEAYIKVLGKGKKEREVGLSEQARMHLFKYIRRYRHAEPGEQHTFLGRAGEPLTTSGIFQIIERLGEWGRVEGVRCSPHTFRHTFATNYLKMNRDIYSLSRLLGHSSVKVTEIYLESFEAAEARRGQRSIGDFMLNL